MTRRLLLVGCLLLLPAGCQEDSKPSPLKRSTEPAPGPAACEPAPQRHVTLPADRWPGSRLL